MIPDSKNNYFNNDTNTPITFKVGIEVKKSELHIDKEIAAYFKKQDCLFSFEGKIFFHEDVEGDFSEIQFEEIKADTQVVYANKDEKISIFPKAKDSAKKQPELNRAFIKLINPFNDCVGIIGSDRDMHDANIDDDSPIHLSPKTFKNYLYRLYLSPQKFHLFEEINKVFSAPPFSYGTISFSEESNKKLELMVKESHFRLPIKYLGSGVLQSLYIITAIICSKSKIVCIEELEQNLSPRKQYEILQKIKLMITDQSLILNQVLISSHSSVYAKPKLGIIYFLQKEDGKTTIKTITKKSVATSVISKELSEHLAPARWEMSEQEFKKLQQDLKRDHDFW